MIRSGQRDHFSSISRVIISPVKPSAVINIHQHLFILAGYSKPFLSLCQIKIRIFAVHRSNSRHIFWFFHSSFNFKRINSRLTQLRNVIKRTDIFKAQNISLFPTFANLIRQTARLGTLPPVPAPSSDHTAVQTLP